jgi:putative transposase
VVDVDESSRTLRRSYKFLLRPTVQQQSAFVHMLDLHREVYNAALEHRREAWARARVPGSFAEQCRQLTEVRQLRPDIGALNRHSVEATLRRLDRAFQDFYRRCQAGEKPGYPRFKGRERFDSVTWSKYGGGFRFAPDIHRLYLSGVGHVRVHAHREVEGRVKTITVKREGRRWYVTLSCDQVPVRPLAKSGAVVGLDLGVASFAATSDGLHIANPRHFAAGAERLAKAQRNLARKQRGSNRRRKARERVASAHRKIREQRRDFHHKTALAMVQYYDLIVHEALASGKMSRSAKGTVDQPGSKVRQKAGLNRSIHDAGWGAFLTILAAKAEDAGRELVAVDPRHTSQRCSSCGHVAAENRVTQAAFCCVACGHQAHAEVNAALNILRAGLALRERSREAA